MRENWDTFREIYAGWKPGTSANALYHWPSVMSPIERTVWGDIRSLGLPFYPQYPVLRFFADFADPIRKIDIEVDGKNFHKDKAKDARRDALLEEAGWTVIRILGSETMKGHEFFEDRCRVEHGSYGGEMCDKHWDEYYSESSEGILRQLKASLYTT